MELQAKWDLVERVAGSTSFRKAPRLRELLKYVAQCTLEGRPEDAREQQIALRVFHRTPGDRPRQDNIVRVGARSLRKRLELYFSGEGAQEPVVILIPKGGYTVRFEPRPEAPQTPPQPAASHPLWSRPKVRVGLALAVLAGLYLMVLLVQRSSAFQARSATHPSSGSSVSPGRR